MRHFASSRFWQTFNSLPERVQTLARKNFQVLKQNPHHPSLHFKKIDKYYSVRVGRQYRAIGVAVDDGVLWFWIGSHSDYDKLIN